MERDTLRVVDWDENFVSNRKAPWVIKNCQALGGSWGTVRVYTPIVTCDQRVKFVSSIVNKAALRILN